MGEFDTDIQVEELPPKQEWIEVEDLHTEEMQDAELQEMLSDHPDITLGQVCRLALAKSAYVLGGQITPYDAEIAVDILKVDTSKATLDELNGAIINALDQANRVFDILVEDVRFRGMKKSEYRVYSPEWLADMLAAAAAAVPSLTIRQMLWELPYVTMVHLYAASYRKSGEITRRPTNEEAAWRKFKQWKAQRQAEEEAKRGDN